MLCFQAEAGPLGPGCVHSAGSCGRVLRGRGEPGGNRSPRGTRAIRHPSHSETVRWAWPGSICRSTRALQAPGAPAVTAREGELDPPVGQPASRWKPGVWDHVHVCGICVSVCEMQARGSAPIPQSSSPPPLRAAWVQAPRSWADGHGASGPLSALAAAAPPRLPPFLGARPSLVSLGGTWPHQ